MKLFFGCTIGFSILTYGAVTLLGLLLGEVGLFIAALLAVGAVFALFTCVLERLEQVERKLDKLLSG